MKTSFVISTLGLAQLIINFFFQFFILNLFGAGEALDIFYASNTLNIIIYAIATSSINNAITPILIKHYKRKNYRIFRELSNSIFNLLFVTFLVLAILQFVFAEQIIHLILPGFSDKKLETTILFFQVQAFISIPVILTSLLIALNYTFEQYYRTIIIPIIGQVLQITFVYFFYKELGLVVLIFGLIILQISTFLLLGIPFLKFYKPEIKLNTELRKSVKIIYPLLLSSSFSKSNLIVDRFFASTLTAGSITILLYVGKIIQMFSSVINKGIGIVTLRKFSFIVDSDEFNNEFVRVYKVLIFIIIPTSLGIIFFLEDTLSLVLISNNIEPEDTKKIYYVVLALIGFFIGGSLNGPITNAFYAKGLTTIIARLNVILQLFGIALKIGLFLIMGFWGLPIAFSINSLVGLIILLTYYNKYISKFSGKIFFKYFLSVLLIATFSTLLSILILENFLGRTLLRLIIASFFFVVSYFSLSYYFEKEISRIVLTKLSNFFYKSS